MGKKKKKYNKQFFQDGKLPAGWSAADFVNGLPPKGKKAAKGWLGALQNNTSHQFLLGAALGATAAYVMSNDQVREKIVRAAVKLYTEVSGGVAELKEQVADMQAELHSKMNGHEQ